MRFTDVVKNLLILNVLFFLATYLANQEQMINWLALHYPESDLFMPVQIATHFFMHGGIGHIFFNMFALVMFGSALETLWGPKRFLFFYFFCAFGAAILHMAYSWWDFSQMADTIQQFAANPDVTLFRDYVSNSSLEYLGYSNGMNGAELADQVAMELSENPSRQAIEQALMLMNDWREAKMDIPVVGASGAVYGLLLAFGMQFPNVELMLIFLPIPIKAKYFIPVLMIIELYLGFNQFSWDNIAHFAHLGGAVSGFFLILYWRKFGTGTS